MPGYSHSGQSGQLPPFCCNKSIKCHSERHPSRGVSVLWVPDQLGEIDLVSKCFQWLGGHLGPLKPHIVSFRGEACQD